jgi:hypothetical protein
VSVLMRTVGELGSPETERRLVMSPIEFRPVTEQDLATGRVRALPPARSAVRAQSSATLPTIGPNADGGWAPSRDQVRRRVLDVVERLRRVQALPVQERADLLVDEAYLRGVLAAARWTLGLTSQRPMDRQEAPVCTASLAGQARHARQVFDAEGDEWDYACGVWMWLQWLTGAHAELTYPEQWGQASQPRR